MYDVSYIMQGRNLVLVIDNQTYTITDSHPNYTQIIEDIKSEYYDDLLDLVDIPQSIARFSDGVVEVVDGEVFYDGEVLHNSLTQRLLDMMEQGFNIDPLVMFLENLMENPSKRAVDELYMFLETNSLPITSDGHFLAYKNVNEDYKDIHSRSFDNSIGSICEMPRNKVDEDRDRTCSTGLHFCSLAYLKSFSGAHTMIVKINPRDVVSIPSDYNNTKGRTCRYEVVGEHESADRYTKEAFTKIVDNRWSPAGPREVYAIDLDTSEVVDSFDNIEEAAREYAIPASYIKRVLRGERNSTGGVGWAYADSYEEPVTDEDVDSDDRWY